MKKTYTIFAITLMNILFLNISLIAQVRLVGTTLSIDNPTAKPCENMIISASVDLEVPAGFGEQNIVVTFQIFMDDVFGSTQVWGNHDVTITTAPNPEGGTIAVKQHAGPFPICTVHVNDWDGRELFLKAWLNGNGVITGELDIDVDEDNEGGKNENEKVSKLTEPGKNQVVCTVSGKPFVKIAQLKKSYLLFKVMNAGMADSFRISVENKAIFGKFIVAPYYDAVFLNHDDTASIMLPVYTPDTLARADIRLKVTGLHSNLSSEDLVEVMTPNWNYISIGTTLINQKAIPGCLSKFSLFISNHDNFSRKINLKISNSMYWETGLTSFNCYLGAMKDTSIEVTVKIPENAPVGFVDSIMFSASSQEGLPRNHSAKLTVEIIKPEAIKLTPNSIKRMERSSMILSGNYFLNGTKVFFIQSNEPLKSRLNAGSSYRNCHSLLIDFSVPANAQSGKYDMVITNPNGLSDTLHDALEIMGEPLSVLSDEEMNSNPAKLSPNPVNNTAVLNFFVPFSNHVEVYICDVFGNKVSQVIEQNLNSGLHNITIETGNLGSGTYYILITGNSLAEVVPIVVIH